MDEMTMQANKRKAPDEEANTSTKETDNVKSRMKFSHEPSRDDTDKATKPNELSTTAVSLDESLQMGRVKNVTELLQEGNFYFKSDVPDLAFCKVCCNESFRFTGTMSSLRNHCSSDQHVNNMHTAPSIKYVKITCINESIQKDIIPPGQGVHVDTNSPTEVCNNKSELNQKELMPPGQGVDSNSPAEVCNNKSNFLTKPKDKQFKCLVCKGELQRLGNRTFNRVRMTRFLLGIINPCTVLEAITDISPNFIQKVIINRNTHICISCWRALRRIMQLKDKLSQETDKWHKLITSTHNLPEKGIQTNYVPPEKDIHVPDSEQRNVPSGNEIPVIEPINMPCENDVPVIEPIRLPSENDVPAIKPTVKKKGKRKAKRKLLVRHKVRKATSTVGEINMVKKKRFSPVFIACEALKKRKYRTALDVLDNTCKAFRREALSLLMRHIRREMYAYARLCKGLPPEVTLENLKQFSWDPFLTDCNTSMPFTYGALLAALATKQKEVNVTGRGKHDWRPRIGLLLSCCLFTRNRIAGNFLPSVIAVHLKQAGCTQRLLRYMHELGISQGNRGVLTCIKRLTEECEGKEDLINCLKNPLQDPPSQVTKGNKVTEGNKVRKSKVGRHKKEARQDNDIMEDTELVQALKQIEQPKDDDQMDSEEDEVEEEEEEDGEELEEVTEDDLDDDLEEEQFNEVQALQQIEQSKDDDEINIDEEEVDEDEVEEEKEEDEEEEEEITEDDLEESDEVLVEGDEEEDDLVEEYSDVGYEVDNLDGTEYNNYLYDGQDAN